MTSMQQQQNHVQPSPSNQPERAVADISVAADETREDLKETGKNLRNRLRDLANQVALPSS